MDLPLYKGFTEEQLKGFGPPKKAEEFTTRRRVYETPFVYENLDVGDFYEIDPTKGIEFKADTGFITITEDRPIVAVTIVGSGCTRAGYNIVEWWNEGECVEHMNDQLVKRQRVDNLNGIHPSVWIEILRKAPWATELTYPGITGGEVKDALDIMSRLTYNFHENLEMSLYENTAYFRVGTKGYYPKKVTIRCGCKGTEDSGTSIERYPADYAVRLVETTVLAED
jgi:hypothetical protein